jgi:hypothetical protein
MNGKKFKVKNRPKRKYIKRSSPISEISLSRSWFIKLMPYFIMSVGLLTTLAITPPAFQSLQPIQPIDISLTKPTLPFDSFIKIFQEILVFSNNTITLLSSLIMQGITTILHVMSLTLSGIVFVVTTIVKGIVVIMSIVEGVILQIATLISDIALSIWHFLIQLIQTLSTILQIIIKTIFDTFVLILMKIGEALNAAWYFLTTPFRALAAYYLTIKPYLDFVLNNIKQSSLFLIESMSLVMGGMK